jgi:hypothetical protein
LAASVAAALAATEGRVDGIAVVGIAVVGIAVDD